MSAGSHTDPTTGLPHAVRTFWSVQCLRGVAALLVVVGHVQGVIAIAQPARHLVRSTLLPWGAGVDLFFVISGFVMVHSSRPLFAKADARITFVRRRLIRVLPLYWLATAAMVVLLALASWKGGDPMPTPSAMVASFLFVPFDTWGDGKLFPVLDLGWTLNYELFFYALFSAFVALPHRRALGGLAVLLAALALVGSVAPLGGAVWFWTRPILIDFGLGVVVGWASSEGIALRAVWRWSVGLLALGVFAADPTSLFTVPLGGTVANEWPRVVWAGLPCALILATLVLGREPRRPTALAPVEALGDASYSLYLFHPFALIVLTKAMQKSALVAGLPSGVLIAGGIGGAIALALVTHRAVELPLTAWLRLSSRSSHRPNLGMEPII